SRWRAGRARRGAGGAPLPGGARQPPLGDQRHRSRRRRRARPPGEEGMTASSARGLSRRKFMAGGAGAGVALASSLAAPPILAQSRAPIRLGNLNSFTGAIAYAAEHNLNGMSLYFDSIGWTIGGGQIHSIE